MTSAAHPFAVGASGEASAEGHGHAHGDGPAHGHEGSAPAYTYAYGYAVPEPGRFTGFFIRLGQRMPVWTASAGVALCVAGGIAYTLLANPTAGDAESRPTCVMRLFTGFDCPGCGGTRAAWYLLHGDIAAAARHHLPLVFATPFLIYVYLAWTLGMFTKRKVPQLRLPNILIIGFLAAWIVFSVARNLPWAPFNWLYV